MQSKISPLYFTVLAQTILTHALPVFDQGSSELPVRMVYQFPHPSWAENIAVRSNGDLLISRADVPELNLIKPDSRNPNATVVHRFTDKLAVLGIAETTPDRFAVIAGNFSLSAGVTPGSFSIYTVTFLGRGPSAQVDKVADLSEGIFLNGMSSLSGDTVLVGDFGGGKIYRVDINNGNYSIISSDPLLTAVPNPITGSAGVNGLHVFENQVFFTNSGQGILGHFPIAADGTQLSNASVFARPLNASLGFDDFAIAHDGTLFMPTTSGNSVQEVARNGNMSKIIAGSLNSTAIAQPTAAQLGRGPRDRDVLYITTAGGLAVPVNGNLTVGAQVVAVDLSGRQCSRNGAMR